MMRRRSTNHLAEHNRDLEQRSTALSKKIASIRKKAEENFQFVDEDTLEETIDDDLEDAGYEDSESIYEDEFEDEFYDPDYESEPDEYGALDVYDNEFSDDEEGTYEVDMPESDSTMESLTNASIKISNLAEVLNSLSEKVNTLKDRKVAALKRKEALNRNYNMNSSKSTSGSQKNKAATRRRVR